MKKLEEYIRSIPDFPEPGIIFRDVTSVLQDPDGLQLAINSVREVYGRTGCGCNCGTGIKRFSFRSSDRIQSA